jgi:hypothetical protein
VSATVYNHEGESVIREKCTYVTQSIYLVPRKLVLLELRVHSRPVGDKSGHSRSAKSMSTNNSKRELLHWETSFYLLRVLDTAVESDSGQSHIL